MPPSLVMSLDGGQTSGLSFVSANRQTGGTIATRGTHSELRAQWEKSGTEKLGPDMRVFPYS